jgi:hypothetical protein
MITIFNRRELFATWDVGERRRVIECLLDNKIDHIRRNSGRGFGGFHGTGAHTCQYYIYVHKKDYERAQYAIKKT